MTSGSIGGIGRRKPGYIFTYRLDLRDNLAIDERQVLDQTGRADGNLEGILLMEFMRSMTGV
jgi:hypothetical protein